MVGEAIGVFLFTDVVGSTRLWAQHTDAMGADLADHDRVLRKAFAEGDGQEFSTAGDSFAAVFRSADDAVSAAIIAQERLGAFDWKVPDGLAVRMGIHLGQAQRRGDDWFGPPLNETARIMGTGHGGQIVVSSAISEQVRGRFELRDLGEHRLRDLDGTWRLHQVDVPGAVNDHPSLRSLATGRTTLPQRRTALIGREQLVRELGHLIGIHRLVTLVGPGGAGKTHSATETAGRLLADLRDGVFFVDLTKVRSADAVVGAFLDGLGVAAPPEADPVDHLLAQLAQRELLLVVDNCEHVLDEAAELIDEVLCRTPNVRVLATSRAGLDVDGEHLHRIPPLDTAGASSPAVRLFVERAMATGADLGLDDVTVASIAQVTARLDGMPLAIELAAARTRTLTPAQILDHLDDRFRLLTGGRQRGRQRRQQTLEAAIDWSYDLLDDAERRAFRWLSVCGDGFDLTTAGGLLGLDTFETSDVLDSLVSKSLVDTFQTAEVRGHRLLETLREFGLARLVEGGELEAAQISLEAALIPPPEKRADVRDTVIHEYGEWHARVALEGVTRRQATQRALAAGRLDNAAMLAYSATAPDEPGGLEPLRRHLAELVRRSDELSDLGRYYAIAGLAHTTYFTGRGAACLAICEEELARRPADDLRHRAHFEAWRLYILGSLAPTDWLLGELERVLPELIDGAESDHDFAVCAAQQTYAARLFMIGEVAEALERCRAALRWAGPGGASEAQSLALLTRASRRAGVEFPPEAVARISALRSQDIGIAQVVPIWESVTSGASLLDRGRALCALARRRPLGRYPREESEFLVAFAHLAVEAGDFDRARQLTDPAMPWDIPTYTAHYEARSQIEGWDDFEVGFSAEAKRIYSRPHIAVAEQAPRVLAAELARWDSPTV